MAKITDDLPPLPLDYLISGINGFSTATLKVKHDFISSLINAHPLISMDFTAGSTFRRARKIDENSYPSSTQDLLWRVGGIASTGRANPEGFPVLYIADRPETAFSETHINDETVLLSELRIRDDAECRVVPIGEFMRVQRTGHSFLAGDLSPAINNMMNAWGLDKIRTILITDAFLLDCLIKDDDHYLISSYVAKTIFETDRKFSAVAYPSVRQYGAVNFAVRTDDFWKSWSIVGARKMRVRHLACGYYETTGTEHVAGITQGGGLVWERGVIENDVARRFDPPWHPDLL